MEPKYSPPESCQMLNIAGAGESLSKQESVADSSWCFMLWLIYIPY